MNPPRNPPYSGLNTLPNAAPPINQNAPLYQNGAHYNNILPSYPPSQPSYARSQVQSPLSSKQNYPNVGMPNYNPPNQQNAQVPHLSNPPAQNYMGQNQHMQMPQPPVVNHQPSSNNRMYQNGYPAPQMPAQNYGQYPQVPPNMNHRYPPVSFLTEV